MSEPAVTIRCFAKVNLGLQVIAARPDGNHDIRTVFHTIDLHDTLTASAAPVDSLDLEWELQPELRSPVPADESNLVLRAAALLKQGRPGKATSFRLVKRIPPGAGLGGGSSDAAGALMAMDRLHGLRLEPAEIHGLAASAGADVPFFLYGGAALGLGRGTEVYPLPEAEPCHFVIGFPGIALETAEVYGAWDDSLTSSPKVGRIGDFAPWCLVLRGASPVVENDLEEAAIRLRPSLKGLRSTLEATGARAVAMTGSGSAFYGLFEDAEEAAEASRRVKEAGYSAMTSRTLGRGERDRSLWAPP